MRSAVAVLLASLLSSVALAMPVAISVGETKNVKLSQRVAQVEVDDASHVEVRREGSRVTLVGKKVGRTGVHLTTTDGAEVSLELIVTSPGGRIFAVKDGEDSKQAAKLAKGERVIVNPRPRPAKVEAAQPAEVVNASDAMSTLEDELSGTH